MLEFDGPKAEKPQARSLRDIKEDVVDSVLSIIVGDSGDPIIEFCHLFAFAGIMGYILKAVV